MIKVRFLGENYTFPEEVAQYVLYCNKFEQINDRLMDELLKTMKKTPMGKGDSAYTDMREKYEGYMQEEGRKVITMLAQIGAYDVTESDVIYNNRGYKYYIDVKTKMNEGSAKILYDSIDSWMDEESSISASAASNIRGSGYGLISNNFLAHATFAAMEYNTLKRQAKKADKEYSRAIDELNKRNHSETDRRYLEFYVSEIYPAIEKAFNMFTAELLTIYIEKLEELNKYDSSKIFKYDLTRAVELLKNLELVPDKKLVIKEAFETCPYNADVYEAVIDCGLFDVESLITAKKFHQEKILENKIENLAKLSLDDKAVVEEYIIVLANYWEGIKKYTYSPY